MKRNTLFSLSLLSALVVSSLSYAAENKLVMEVDIPRFNVAEYHKPYVAIWLEDSKRKATQIELWYDFNMKENEGDKWLKDIRQWWRRVGRKSEQPFDGITSATKGPGTHKVSIALGSEQFSQLPAGEYQLRVEASREVGGKEVINIPLTLPAKASDFPLKAVGKTELGKINIQLVND